jgi:hypothetical protein
VAFSHHLVDVAARQSKRHVPVAGGFGLFGRREVRHGNRAQGGSEAVLTPGICPAQGFPLKFGPACQPAARRMRFGLSLL